MKRLLNLKHNANHNYNDAEKQNSVSYDYTQINTFTKPGYYQVFSDVYGNSINYKIQLNKKAQIHELFPVVICSRSRLGQFETFINIDDIVIQNLNFIFIETSSTITFKIIGNIYAGIRGYWYLYFQRRPSFIVDIINHNT